MSVYISDFSGPQWTVVHDDARGGPHEGTIDPATVTHVVGMDGNEDHKFITVTCPVCQSVSTHPVGGGAQPVLVQQLFVVKAAGDGCVCGQTTAGDAHTAESHVRLNCNRMDGPGRWQLDTGQGARSRTAEATIQGLAAPEAMASNFEVVFRDSDRMILGMEPTGPVGTGNSVWAIPIEEYTVLMETEPAWLSTDGHVLASAPA